MPVSFLSDDQAARYGRYAGDPSPAQLARYFFLDPNDLGLIERRRGDHNRLGFAIQLGTVRFLGTFLTDPIAVPIVVVQHLAQQLGMTDLSVLPRYLERVPTRYDHAREIQEVYGYRAFTDQPEHFHLVRWLYTRAWLSDERPSILFDLTTARLIERKILLPGVSVLTRLIAQVRDRVSIRLWRVLGRNVTVDQQIALQALLSVPPNARMTQLEQLRRKAVGTSSTSMLRALKRVEQVRTFMVGPIDVSAIPPARLEALSRYAVLSSAAAFQRMPPERQMATLIAFIRAMEMIANDDAYTMLDAVITELIRKAKFTAQQKRLRTLKDLDAAALQLSTVCRRLIDPTHEDVAVRAAIYADISEAAIAAAIERVEGLARPPEVNIQPELIERYTMIRRFFPTLLRVANFKATPAGEDVLEALDFLRGIEDERNPDMRQAPRDMIPRPWKKFVQLPRRELDRAAYTLCLLEQLQVKLRRHDIFVTPSNDWGDLRTRLLQGNEWIAQRPHVCRILGHQPVADVALSQLSADLDAAFRRVADHLSTNAAVHVETHQKKERLKVDRLDKLEEPQRLVQLRERVAALMPRVDLAEALLEIHARTGFADEFTPLGSSNPRMADLPISICAVLLASACNIGIEPLIRPDIPALTRRRLEWVQFSCIRAETLSHANARLVDAQTTIPLAQQWGGGAVASADGLRFIVPIRAVNTGPSSPYFGTENGATFLNFTSDQFTGFHGIVVPGTLRDSPYILDGLLENQTSLHPTELITDTAGYSDVIFGLFWLLGYQFSPRLADIGETRLWRIDRQADYGKINGVSKNAVSTHLIRTHWDDLLRVAGSLKLKTVRASTFIRALQAGHYASTLARAMGELGRIAKTQFLLAYIDDATYRRRVLTQLNRGEERHRLAREIFYGRRGELRQRYREGQEDQLNALGLVLNVLVLWNTWYMDQALTYLRREGTEIQESDVVRLWPLTSAHFNMIGRYSFALPDIVSQGSFRPLTQTVEPTETV
ncbi:Tn3 family transposase [Chloroflexia bacterium SDU3-3]|nr:Tn3 family transposase [Chloroflexia bacterium SDU3-3]